MRYILKVITVMMILLMISAPIVYAATASSKSSSSASGEGSTSSSSSIATGGGNSDSSSSKDSGDIASSSSSATASDGGTATANSETDSTNGGSATANSNVVASGEGVVADCEAIANSDGSNARKDCEDIKTVVLKEDKETKISVDGATLKIADIVPNETEAINEITKEEPKTSSIVGDIVGKILRLLHLKIFLFFLKVKVVKTTLPEFK